jgi:hypothetical protein
MGDVSEEKASDKTVDADKGTEPAQLTLLEQMGGIGGLAYSSVPVLVFILVNSFGGLTAAIWTALGSGVAIAVWRVVRKEKVQPAISGLLGVAVAAWIAHRTGSAKGFFLFGIWVNLVYGGAFLLSILVRWPLVGVAWGALNNTGFGWRSRRRVLLGYDLATLSWVAVFAARYVVQRWLYESNEVGWLAFARIAMGYPLTALALLVTVWAVRRDSADRRDAQARASSTQGDASPAEAKSGRNSTDFET